MTKRISKKNAIKAYKIFNADWTCRGFQYAVNEEFHFKGNVKLCRSGFHACTTAADCFTYYQFNQDELKFAEVSCWGTVIDNDEDSKICCSDIKIIREIPWKEMLAICNPGKDNIGFNNTGNYNSGHYNTGNHNFGSRNLGDRNLGDQNLGSRNFGDYNFGDYNSGHSNLGFNNFGHSNYGNYNTGNYNIGHNNTGDCNTGDRNSGNWNSGSWNSGEYNTGYFNTKAQDKIFVFNKPIKRRDIDFPYFCFFRVTEWIPFEKMTAKEKKAHPRSKVTGGYLKKLKYKDAFRKAFIEAKTKENWKEELRTLKAIPNFNYAIFEEISGITKQELES